MKKNLRIASAAAAALLAVAPVAASAVSPVFAGTAATTATKYVVPGYILLDRTTQTDRTFALNSTQISTVLDQLGIEAKNVDVNGTVTGTRTKNPKSGTFYQDITLTLTKKDGSVFSGDYSSKGAKLSTDKKTLTYDVVAYARFAAQQGTPYFFNKKTNQEIVNGGTVTIDDLGNRFSAKTLADKVNALVSWKTSNSDNDKANLVTSEADVEKQLVAQGLKRLPNDEFDYPANGFNLKLTATSENGETTSITVRINSNYNYNAPVFVVAPKDVTPQLLFNGATIRAVKTLDLNKAFDAKAFLADNGISAYIQSAYNGSYDKTVLDVQNHQQKVAAEKVSVDSSAVNTSVAGLYNVVVSATNPAGYTSKLNVTVQVGDPTVAQMYVAADGVKVYNINGYVVTESTKTLNKGQAVQTYGKATVAGVEYTRISKDNSEWVKTSDLTATAPSTAEVTTTKTIWHVAKIYDKDGKPTSEASLHAYNTVSVVSTPVTINGAKYYKLAGKDQYVKAGNIDGTSRTLSHNAYVYKNTGKAKTTKSGKKTKKVLLKKGSQVTTYGSAFTVNGHKMFRIGRNQYVKVANF